MSATDRPPILPAPEGKSTEHAEFLDRIAAALSTGDVSAEGLLPWSSNYVFLAVVQTNGFSCRAAYKPQRGERPLWDFPEGTLCHRETAAYLMSKALGWDFVPPTVLRDGPHGLGSFQWFVPADPEANYFTLRETYPDEFQRVALFDILINNADRKAGHCLLGFDGRIWLIDHGICFHTQPKLRTVIWDYVGEVIPDGLRVDLDRFREQLRPRSRLTATLAPLLSAAEIAALRQRTEQLLTHERFPPPAPGRPYPWPLV